MLATGAVDRLKRRSRPVNGPLSLPLDSVNSLFAILFHTAEKWLKSAAQQVHFCRSTINPGHESWEFGSNLSPPWGP